MTAREMTCRDLVELVTEYLDGALDAEDRAHFERHLGSCPACPAHLDQMRKTILAVGQLREESIPISARDELLEAFRDWRHRP